MRWVKLSSVMPFQSAALHGISKQEASSDVCSLEVAQL
jgi:hypothetical protein